jgi:hypothetical protein
MFRHKSENVPNKRFPTHSAHCADNVLISKIQIVTAQKSAEVA